MPFEIKPTRSRSGDVFHSDVIPNRPQSLFDLGLKLMGFRKQLGKLRGCEVHSSVMLSAVDEKIFRRLGMNLTCEPCYRGTAQDDNAESIG